MCARSHNKAFKADSQRLAVRFESALVFTAQWFNKGGSVAHYLTRRYVFGGNYGKTL